MAMISRWFLRRPNDKSAPVGACFVCGNRVERVGSFWNRADKNVFLCMRADCIEACLALAMDAEVDARLCRNRPAMANRAAGFAAMVRSLYYEKTACAFAADCEAEQERDGVPA